MENALMRGAVQFGRIVLPPIARRLGTGFAVFLVAKGVPEDLASQVMTAVGVVGGLTLDVVASLVSRRRG